MLRKTLKSIVFKTLFGVISGILYYALYVLALPLILSHFGALTPLSPISMDLMHYLGFFIALGVAESALSSHILSVPLRVFTKLFGALLLYEVLSGGRLNAVIVGEDLSSISVELDISPLLYIVIIGSLIYGVLDALTYFKEQCVKS